MPTMEIDGKKVAWEGKKMILQAALDAGIEIPSYCYHPGLSIVASCRICLGEIESPDPKDPTKLVRVPKLIPTCQTPAADGMRGLHEVAQDPKSEPAGHRHGNFAHQPSAGLPRSATRPANATCRTIPTNTAVSESCASSKTRPKKSQRRTSAKTSSSTPTAVHHMCTRCRPNSRAKFPARPNSPSSAAATAKRTIDVFPGPPRQQPARRQRRRYLPWSMAHSPGAKISSSPVARLVPAKSTPSICPMTSAAAKISKFTTTKAAFYPHPSRKRFNAAVNKWWDQRR